MKNIVIAALAATSALAASSAGAQSTTATGTVSISGSVGAKCQVVSGSTASGTFAASVALGELAENNGLLKSSSTLSSLFNAGGTGSSALTFRVVCTTATPAVTLNADPIASSATAPTGYANRVDYEAKATFALVSGGPQNVTNDSTAASATAASLTDRLAGSGNNVTITASNFRTPNATDIMVADPNYSGQIVVVISPS